MLRNGMTSRNYQSRNLGIVAESLLPGDNRPLSSTSLPPRAMTLQIARYHCGTQISWPLRLDDISPQHARGSPINPDLAAQFN